MLNSARSTPFISVIIPVKNQKYFLQTCLQALMVQSYPAEKYEIIVVDNNSMDSPQELKLSFPRVVFLSEPKLGAGTARNKGLSYASGYIIAFTDADCIPGKDWLWQGMNQLTVSSTRSIVGGTIYPFFIRPQKPTVCEFIDFILFLDQEYYAKKLHFVATANLFTYKHIFNACGLFNEKVSIYGEDRDWCQRAWRSGYNVEYFKSIAIQHYSRRTISELSRKMIKMIINESYFENRFSWAQICVYGIKKNNGFLHRMFIALSALFVFLYFGEKHARPIIKYAKNNKLKFFLGGNTPCPITLALLCKTGFLTIYIVFINYLYLFKDVSVELIRKNKRKSS